MYYVRMNSFFAKAQRIVFSLFIFVAIFFVASNVQAQNNFRYVFKQTQLDADTFFAGEIVSGFFTIENKTSQPLDTLLYQIEFVTLTPAQSEIIDYAVIENASSSVVQAKEISSYLASDAIVTSELLPIETINSLQDGRIRFSFKLPERLPEGALGMVVQLYDDTLRKGEKEIIPLQIDSPRQYSLFNQLSLVTINNNESFGPLDGPIVEKIESINLFISIENTSKNTVQVMPTFEYFSGGILDGVSIETIEQDPMLLRAGEQEGVTHILPVSSREPGEYTIKITHADIRGDQLTTPLYVKYFVGGMKSSIASVDYSGFDMNRQDSFVATVSYSPKPFNIRGSGSDGEQQQVGVQVMIFDTADDALITQTEVNSFDNRKTTTVPLPETLPSGEYIIQFHLYEGNSIVETRNDDVIIVGRAEIDAQQGKVFSDYKTQIIISLLLFAVVVMVAVILLMRQKRQKELQEQKVVTQYVPKKFEVD